MKSLTLAAVAVAGTVALASGANAASSYVYYPPTSAYAYYPPDYSYDPPVRVYERPVTVYERPVAVYRAPVAVYTPPVRYETVYRREYVPVSRYIPEPDYPYYYYWPGHRFSNQNWHGR